MARGGRNAHEQREHTRVYWAPEQVAARIAADQRDQREVCAAIACPDPDCAKPAGECCFGPEARNAHYQREQAFGKARWLARALREGV